MAAAEVDEAPERVAGGGTAGAGMPAASEAKEAWKIAVSENTIAAYRAVVEHFSGFYATLARAKVEELEAAALAEERRARRAALAEKLGREFSPDAVGENGWTDLHWAAVLDLPGLARELVERGMEVDVRLDEGGERIGESLKRTLRELGRDFDAWGSDGETPLHLAAWENALSVAEYLAGQGADVNAKNSGNGGTPLHSAAARDALGMAELLIGHGADVNAESDYDMTILHEAARSGALPVVEYLVGQGADVNAEMNNGGTVLHHAARSGALHRAAHRRHAQRGDVDPFVFRLDQPAAPPVGTRSRIEKRPDHHPVSPESRHRQRRSAVPVACDHLSPDRLGPPNFLRAGSVCRQGRGHEQWRASHSMGVPNPVVPTAAPAYCHSATHSRTLVIREERAPE